jgi:hypothetical protein
MTSRKIGREPHHQKRTADERKASFKQNAEGRVLVRQGNAVSRKNMGAEAVTTGCIEPPVHISLLLLIRPHSCCCLVKLISSGKNVPKRAAAVL